jgi:hypothetical protein
LISFRASLVNGKLARSPGVVKTAAGTLSIAHPIC